MRVYTVGNGYDNIELEDTPAHREWLETLAIPRCTEWRHANLITVSCVFDHPTTPPCPTTAPAHAYPEPYCPSAYCPRCAGLRELDGVPEMVPNAWLYEAESAGALAEHHP